MENATNVQTIIIMILFASNVFIAHPIWFSMPLSISVNVQLIYLTITNNNVLHALKDKYGIPKN